jgi:hypothetical protein
MAGGPEDHFTDGRWNWWLPDWAASSSASTRRPCRRRRPRSEAGIRVHLRSAEKGRHSPSQLERPVAQVVPREGRGRSASHPPNRLQGSQQTHPVDIPQEVVGSSRRSPAIPANHRDRTPAHGVIPVYPRPARNYQDRPVTPEVAGSSPVAPVKSLQIGIFFCPLWRNRPPAFDRSRAHPARASGRGPVSVKPCKSPCSVAGDGVRVLGDPAAIPQADRPAVLGGADWNYEWPEASCSSGCCDVAAVSFRVW